MVMGEKALIQLQRHPGQGLWMNLRILENTSPQPSWWPGAEYPLHPVSGAEYPLHPDAVHLLSHPECSFKIPAFSAYTTAYKGFRKQCAACHFSLSGLMIRMYSWKGSKLWHLKLSLMGLPWWDGASLIAQLVKNPPAMQETPVQFLGQDDPLEKG